MPIDGPVSWHPRKWTLGEVLALPEDNGQRIELVDGTLIVSPAPEFKHQRIQHRVQIAVHNALPPGLELLPGINVVLAPQRLLIPDLTVTTIPGVDALYCDAADVLLVVEIVSPSSRTFDRAQKRILYAEAGIPYYLVIDSTASPVLIELFRLEAGEYRSAERGEDGTAKLAEPFSVELDFR